MPDFSIAGRAIGPDEPPYVVAEIGASHNGNLDRALSLMDAAKAAGADACKLQTYRPDTITIDHDGPGFVLQDGPWKGRKLFELYAEAATPWEWHGPLFEYARSLGLACFSSPFDPNAVDFLETLGCPAYKVASFEIVDLPLIRHIASKGKPVIISTGMASASEIHSARAALGMGLPYALLHCVSGYPTPAAEADLNQIGDLILKYPAGVIGLSDHTLGIAVPIAAVALGACIIEKHLTLSRADGGPDAAFSLEPAEFKVMTIAARRAWEACRPCERRASEETSRPLRRSLYAVADVAAGEPFTAQNVRSIRPGLGLAPKHLDEVIGRTAARAVRRGEPMAWEMVDAG